MLQRPNKTTANFKHLMSLQKQRFKKHLERLASATHQVDDKPTKINIQSILKLNKMIQTAKAYNKISDKNAGLFGDIKVKNYTYKSETFQCVTPKDFRGNVFFKKKKLLKLQKENRQLIHRLNNIMNRDRRRIDKLAANELKCKIGNFKLPTKILEKYKGTVPIPKDPCKQFQLFRPSILMDLEAKGERSLGRIVFQFYTEACPEIVLELIRFFEKKRNGKKVRFPRIYNLLWAECVIPLDKKNSKISENIEYDFRALNISEGSGIISFALQDLKLVKEGLIPIAISFKPLPAVSTSRIAIGRIIHGHKDLLFLREYGTKIGIPLKEIIATHIGLF